MRSHARLDGRRRPRPFTLGFLKGLFFQLVIFFETFLDKTKELPKKKKHTKKLRVNVVLNNKVDPMHDTTNTCSCDGGVRS